MPKSCNELGKLVEAFSLDQVETLRSDAALVEQAGFPQYGDVLGNGRPRQFEPAGDGPGRHFPLANETNNLESRLVAQGLNLHQCGQLFVHPSIFIYVR